MKIRNGFVSNSSSSSFVILKDALSELQCEKIFNYIEEVELLISKDEEENWQDFQKPYTSDAEKYRSEEYKEQKYTRLKYILEYYKTNPWRIVEYEDFIFGETTMDNFDMGSFLDIIKVDENFISWDDGWIDNPTSNQRNELIRMKQELRSKKIKSINK